MGAEDGASDAPAFANPLAPRSAPKPTGSAMASATPLSNDDFRKLLTTSRAPAGGRTDGFKGARRGDDFQKPNKPRPKSKPRPKPSAPSEPEGPTYRDRAKERRLEAAPEYQGDQSGAILAGVRGGVPGVVQNDELRQLSVEESKFLGGDVEHTHLVKGLDFALLRKVRAELKESEKDVAFERSKATPTEAAAVPEAPVEFGGASSEWARATMRGVFEAEAIYKKRDTPADKILPDERFSSGRVAFRFDLSSEGHASEVPTTITRSKSDKAVTSRLGSSSGSSAFALASQDLAVIEKLSERLVAMRQKQLAETGTGDTKTKRRDARTREAAEVAARLATLTNDPAASRANAPVDDDEDIFGDAGRDYAPAVALKDAQGDKDKTASYFGAGAARGEASMTRKTTKAKEGSKCGSASFGPMPEPPAPDFGSIKAFKAHYAAYVRAGFSEGGAWNPNAAGEYLRTCPDFALAITAHSVTVATDPEVADAEEADRSRRPKPAVKTRPPLDAAAAKAELERRAEESLAADDGYGVSAGAAYGHATFYASDDEEEEGKKKKETDEGEDAGTVGKKGGKKGLGGNGKDGKAKVKDLEARRDQKLDAELGDLQKMMQEKYGDKVNVAFGEGAEKGGEKREKQGEGEDGGDGGRRAKRFRI